MKLYPTRHGLYGTYSAMRARCYSKNATGFQRYGALGISVCARWRESFWNKADKYIEELK